MGKPPKVTSPLGERLVRLRGTRSRGEFAEQIGVHAATLGNYERGDRSPDLDFLTAVREATGVNINWLATGDGEMFEGDLKVTAAALDSRLLDRLGRAALQVYGDIKRNLPHAQVSGEAARLYNDLVELGVDLGDADAVEASIPLLQHRLKRRLEQAAADPATDKRRA